MFNALDAVTQQQAASVADPQMLSSILINSSVSEKDLLTAFNAEEAEEILGYEDQEDGDDELEEEELLSRASDATTRRHEQFSRDLRQLAVQTTQLNKRKGGIRTQRSVLITLDVSHCPLR